MAVLRILAILAVTAVLVNVAIAKTCTVGSSDGGWDTSTDLTTWATSQKFSVGDTLVFQYQAMHSVLEVTKADFDSCDTSNPIQGDTSGTTTIPLTSAGKRYFICGSVGHCGLGMKIEVDTAVVSPVATPPPVKTNPSPVTHSTPPPVKTNPAPVTHSTPPPKKTTPAPKTPSPPPPKKTTPAHKHHHSRHVALVSSPETAPAVSPSPAKSLVTSPTGYPDVHSSVTPASSPSPNGSLSAKSKSSATKAHTLLGSAVGLSFAMVMLLIL